MRSTTRVVATLAASVALAIPTAGIAQASLRPAPRPTVVSEVGIIAVQIAKPGASEAQVENAIEAYQTQPSTSRLGLAPVTPLGTADYYSYCQEGSSGLMVWTNNSPSNCYGWYYQYLNGQRISKVNMIQLKAAGGTGPNPAALVAWCDSHGTYCMVVTWIVQGLGAYLIGLLD